MCSGKAGEEFMVERRQNAEDLIGCFLSTNCKRILGPRNENIVHRTLTAKAKTIKILSYLRESKSFGSDIAYFAEFPEKKEYWFVSPYRVHVLANPNC